MANITINNLARAIYESSKDKEGSDLDIAIKKSVDVIANKHLLSKSEEILTHIEKIIDKDNGIIRARVTSNKKINKETIEEIEDFIKKRYRAKKIILELEIDKELLGGIKIEVEDEIIDTTLKNKIKKLKNYLIKN